MDSEGGALTWVGEEFDGAVVGLNHLVDFGEAKPISLFFGGEEGTKDLFQILLLDTAAVIGDGEVDPIAIGGEEGAHLSFAAGGVDSVDVEVEEGPFEELGVELGEEGGCRFFEEELDLSDEGLVGSDELDHILDELAEADPLELDGDGPGVVEDVGDESVEDGGPFDDGGGHLGLVGVFFEVAREECGKPFDAAEGVADLVGDGCGHLSELFEPVVASGEALELADLGAIAQQEDEAEVGGGDGEFEVALPPIGAGVGGGEPVVPLLLFQAVADREAELFVGEAIAVGAAEHLFTRDSEYGFGGSVIGGDFARGFDKEDPLSHAVEDAAQVGGGGVEFGDLLFELFVAHFELEVDLSELFLQRRIRAFEFAHLFREELKGAGEVADLLRLDLHG